MSLNTIHGVIFYLEIILGLCHWHSFGAIRCAAANPGLWVRSPERDRNPGIGMF